MESIPKHIGIILDGNRRFAKRLLLEPWKGHKYGAEKVEKLLDYMREIGIKEVTLYCLSVENINNRPKNELEYLFKLFRKEFREMDRQKLMVNGIRIKFIGNLDLLPADLKEQCLKLEKETEMNKDYIVNFALAYGGRQEIIEAVRKIVSKKLKPEEINEEVFGKNLWLSSEPELIIRTGGEKRTSNFLPWQAAYAELLFLDKLWPEFEKEDLVNAIEEFKRRKRNFGK